MRVYQAWYHCERPGCDVTGFDAAPVCWNCELPVAALDWEWRETEAPEPELPVLELDPLNIEMSVRAYLHAMQLAVYTAAAGYETGEPTGMLAGFRREHLDDVVIATDNRTGRYTVDRPPLQQVRRGAEPTAVIIDETHLLTDEQMQEVRAPGTTLHRWMTEAWVRGQD